MMAGGISEIKPATPEIQAIADQVKSELEEKVNTTYEVFEAIEYRIQIIGGKEYFIKVSVSDSTDECVHLKVFQGIPPEDPELSLIDYETGKTKEDELIPF